VEGWSEGDVRLCEGGMGRPCGWCAWRIGLVVMLWPALVTWIPSSMLHDKVAGVDAGREERRRKEVQVGLYQLRAS